MKYLDAQKRTIVAGDRVVVLTGDDRSIPRGAFGWVRALSSFPGRPSTPAVRVDDGPESIDPSTADDFVWCAWLRTSDVVVVPRQIASAGAVGAARPGASDGERA